MCCKVAQNARSHTAETGSGKCLDRNVYFKIALLLIRRVHGSPAVIIDFSVLALTRQKMSAEVDSLKMDSLQMGESERPKFYPKKKEVQLPPPDSLDSMIEGLQILFAKDHVNIEEVRQYMSGYKSVPGEWGKYAKFDAHKYTRNLVDVGNGKYNLILLCWGEGQGSSIHDHADSHCFYKVLRGSLTETLYEWPKGKKKSAMHSKNSFSLKTNEVGYINDSYGLHRVENKSHTERAVSLHLYAPPFDMCQSFDERSGHITRCKVTFWSKFGERTPMNKGQSTCENN